MTTVYTVLHVDLETDDDDDHEKLIGVYSTEARAREAIERLRDKPGFRDYPQHWCIDPTMLDEDSAWTTGFVTIHRGDDYAKEGR